MDTGKETIELVEFTDVNGKSIFIKIEIDKSGDIVDMEADESRLQDFSDQPQPNNFNIVHLNATIFY